VEKSDVSGAVLALAQLMYDLEGAEEGVIIVKDGDGYFVGPMVNLDCGGPETTDYSNGHDIVPCFSISVFELNYLVATIKRQGELSTMHGTIKDVFFKKSLWKENNKLRAAHLQFSIKK